MAKKTKIIAGIAVLAAILIASYFIFFRKQNQKYSLAKVAKANVVQEVSESGTVKMGDEINLSFKSAGRIQKIYVKTGDKVKAGQSLAQLDVSQLGLQLKQAQAAKEVSQAQLNKLLAGASEEEIKIAETEVNNKQISLDIAKENLNQAYQDALDNSESSYLKLYNAYIVAYSVQRTYFYSTDQESLKVAENKAKIQDTVSQAKSSLDIAKNNPINENVDAALLVMKIALDLASNALAAIRQSCEVSNYQNTVSSTDKTSLDTQRTNINTAQTNTIAAQQNISSMKLNEVAAEGALHGAQDQLSKLTATPRQEDIDLYKSQVAQSQAQVDILNVQITDATIISPVAGEITDINKDPGEVVQPTEAVISFLGNNPFEIKVDIYEEDIVKVRVGESVEIKLTAFPDKIFNGKVIAVDPAEKIIDGVVYYEVTIDFEGAPSGLKPGMTADITIKTDSKENVLSIPKSAIEEKEGKKFVQVLKNKKVQERQIQIGLEGSNDLVEVLSGLGEGEEVILNQ